MAKETINTTNAPKAIGPYSQAVKAGNLVFVSGQLPIDHGTGEIVNTGIEAQTRQCMKNVLAILGEAGLGGSDIIKSVIYVKDLKEFDTINAAYGSFFEKDFPARACVEVSRLPKDVGVEIETIAMFSA